jgi:hypothetical protein
MIFLSMIGKREPPSGECGQRRSARQQHELEAGHQRQCEWPVCGVSVFSNNLVTGDTNGMADIFYA